MSYNQCPRCFEGTLLSSQPVMDIGGDFEYCIFSCNKCKCNVGCVRAKGFDKPTRVGDALAATERKLE